MSALSYAQLKAFLLHAEIDKRLVISPLLDPAEQLKPNQAGIDVRLGRVFSFVRPWVQPYMEGVVTETGDFSTNHVVDTFVLDYGEPLIMHPHQFVLARTLEIARLPSNLLAYVIGRSSWGRRGLIVATAVVVHPGFSGPVTLELKNVGELPIALYPMDKIAQLTFHEVGGGGSNIDVVSQFSSSFVPGLGSVRDIKTQRVIEGSVAMRRGQKTPTTPQQPVVANPVSSKKP
jgi:dCTP deaminase